MTKSTIVQRNKLGTAQVTTSNKSIARLLGYKGDVGATGEKGTSGWRGEYTDSDTYAQFDIVRYYGTVYILTAEGPVTNINPLDDTKWDIFVEKGLNGTSVSSSSSDNGFENLTDSIIEIDLILKKVIIRPNQLEYKYNLNGLEIIKDVLESINIPSASNIYYIYFNILNDISISSNRPDFINNTLICSFYYNLDLNKIIFYNDLRHSSRISDYTKRLFYFESGQIFYKGLNFNTQSTGLGDNDSDCSISVMAGETLNIDLLNNIPYTDKFNILYFINGVLYSTDIKNYIVKINNGIEYNKDLNTLENVTTAKPFVISWLISIGDTQYIVLSSESYISLGDAKEAIFTNFKDEEYKNDVVLLHKIIIKYDVSYLNSIKASIVYYESEEDNQTSQIINGGDKNFVFEQLFSSDEWIIDHDLNKIPSVTIIDSGLNSIEGDVTYINNNKIKINFTQSFTGKVYLN